MFPVHIHRDPAGKVSTVTLWWRDGNFNQGCDEAWLVSLYTADIIMMTAAQEKVWAALPSWWCLLFFIPAGLRCPDSSLCVLAWPVVFPHALLPELNWWVYAAPVHFHCFFCQCVVFRCWYFLYVSFALLDCACLSESLIIYLFFKWKQWMWTVFSDWKLLLLVHVETPTRLCGSAWAPRPRGQILEQFLPSASTTTAHACCVALPKDRYCSMMSLCPVSHLWSLSFPGLGLMNHPSVRHIQSFHPNASNLSLSVFQSSSFFFFFFFTHAHIDSVGFRVVDLLSLLVLQCSLMLVY